MRRKTRLPDQQSVFFITDATFKSAKCRECPKQLKVWPADVGQPAFQCQLGLNCERLQNRTGKKRGRRRRGNKDASVDPEKDSFEFAVDEEGRPVSAKAAEPVWCENNGENRLCCFEHGYEICDRCAVYLDRVEENGILTTRIASSISSIGILIFTTLH